MAASTEIFPMPSIGDVLSLDGNGPVFFHGDAGRPRLDDNFVAGCNFKAIGDREAVISSNRHRAVAGDRHSLVFSHGFCAISADSNCLVPPDRLRASCADRDRFVGADRLLPSSPPMVIGFVLAHGLGPVQIDRRPFVRFHFEGPVISNPVNFVVLDRDFLVLLGSCR